MRIVLSENFVFVAFYSLLEAFKGGFNALRKRF